MSNQRAATAAPKKTAGKKQATSKAPAKKKTPKKKAGRPVTVGADTLKAQRLPGELVERVEKRMRAVGCNWSDAVRQGLELWLKS